MPWLQIGARWAKTQQLFDLLYVLLGDFFARVIGLGGVARFGVMRNVVVHSVRPFFGGECATLWRKNQTVLMTLAIAICLAAHYC